MWCTSSTLGLLGVDDHLHHAAGVAQVEEDHPAVVATGRDPARERDLGADVGDAAASPAPCVRIIGRSSRRASLTSRSIPSGDQPRHQPRAGHLHLLPRREVLHRDRVTR